MKIIDLPRNGAVKTELAQFIGSMGRLKDGETDMPIKLKVEEIEIAGMYPSSISYYVWCTILEGDRKGQRVNLNRKGYDPNRHHLLKINKNC